MASAAASSKKPFNFLKWAKSRKGQQTLIIIGFSIIPLILLFTFTYYPFAEMAKFSLYDRNYTKVRGFVGLKNYADVFGRPDIFKSLFLSLYYMGGAVVQLALALYLATVFCFGVKGGNFFKGCMFFPYLINGIAIGFIFKFFYTRGFVLDTVLQWIGFDLESLPFWLKDTSINNVSLVGTSVWKYFGQNMVLFVGAMMSVDATLYEAADLDGVNGIQRFFYVTLPQLKPTTFFLTITGIISSFKVFGQINVMTQGGPGTSTYTLVYYIYKQAFSYYNMGYASAVAMILFLLLLCVTVVQWRHNKED